MDLRLTLFFGIFALIMTFALSKGGTPEKLAAAIFCYGVISTIALQGPMATRFLSMEMGVFFVDATMLIFLLVLSLFAERYWPIWIASFQIIQTLSHLPKLLIPHMLPEAYETIVTVWVYPMLIILAWATVRHRERVLTHGSDRSWSDFSLA